MSEPSQPAEEVPVLQSMRSILARAVEAAKNPNVAPGLARMTVNRFHFLLAKIYGKKSKEVSSFPLLTQKLSDQEFRSEFKKRVEHAARIVNELSALPANTAVPSLGKRVFIGHGRSPLWRELKDFLSDRLQLPWDEFNREPVAGLATSERLQSMLSHAGFAFLIMTAEDEHADGTVHARMNVVHEVGLFQGRVGIRKAIVLLEEGCPEFSNITGLSQIRFPKGDISARFEDIRRVLEREGLL